MANSYRPANRDGFGVAIICALTVETNAVEAFFSEVWSGDDSYGKIENDSNIYKTGRIGKLPVVLVQLPNIGSIAAANVATSLHISFPRIKLCLVVGICGGAPNNGQKEILLGDVIMSGALIDYANGRQYSDHMIRRTELEDILPRPSIAIRNFLKQYAGMGMRDLVDDTCVQLDQLLSKSGFEGSKYPGPNEDKLFHSTYRHKHHTGSGSNPPDCEVCSKCQDWHHPVCEIATQSDCSVLRCEDSMLITRTRLEKIKNIIATQPPPTSMLEAIKIYRPEIHIGRVASANLVMKSSYHRDRLAERDKAIAFEMEGPGVWEIFPTIIIKAVFNYADSHKNKVWQPYAAAVAASCMSAVLKEWESAHREQRR
ncbi:hypothetical protein Dda_8694 [Drechslerella dactyloides]|uniref:Nucleoside phosphorylase domain-containing protein n=1 Tax=Drechslerella dactyloides TaxID=74499 RepID=A0AAD6NEY3_DREDA|nr:hypothetical protein Dda_8694 [Drechslerella dactyloides]